MLVHWVVLRSYPAFLSTQNPVLGLDTHLHRTATNKNMAREKLDTLVHTVETLGIPEKSSRVYGTEIEKTLVTQHWR